MSSLASRTAQFDDESFGIVESWFSISPIRPFKPILSPHVCPCLILTLMCYWYASFHLLLARYERFRDQFHEFIDLAA
jgi:hypothetical protein